MTFQVKGANPGGVGGYQGSVTLTKLSKATAKIRWVAGADKQVTEGFAIKTETKGKAIGSAYGPGLYALAVYELGDNGIHAIWSMATKPEESGTYDLKGSNFEGTLTFADGTPGAVTFTPKKDGVFKVVWNLASGSYEGIGLRRGDVLVAASGDLKTGFGIGAYALKGEAIEGQWLMTGMEQAGSEVWTLPADTPTAGTPAPEKNSDAELAKAIKGDIDKCVTIAREFMGHIQTGDAEKAVGLMSDSAFTKVSRESFVESLKKSNEVFGALKGYQPDKGVAPFGMEGDVVTFKLQADAEYANAKVRETLKFVRNKQGGIDFIGYNRTAKE